MTQFIEQCLAENQARDASAGTSAPAIPAPARFDNAPWLELTRRHVKPGMSHGMDEIRAALTEGWFAETAEKCCVLDADP